MNKHQGFVELAIDLESGKTVTLPLRYGSEEIGDVEHATGKTIFEILGNPEAIGFYVMRALLFHGIPEKRRMKEGYRTPRDVAGLITFTTFASIAQKVFEAIRLYMPDEIPDDLADDTHVSTETPGEAEPQS